MTQKALQTILFLLAEHRDDTRRTIEFAATQIIPPMRVPHLEERVRDIEDAISQIETCFNVRIVRREEAEAA